MNKVGDVIAMSASDAQRLFTLTNDEMTRNMVQFVVTQVEAQSGGPTIITAEHPRTGCRWRIPVATPMLDDAPWD
jgi:hypothetical protein